MDLRSSSQSHLQTGAYSRFCFDFNSSVTHVYLHHTGLNQSLLRALRLLPLHDPAPIGDDWNSFIFIVRIHFSESCVMYTFAIFIAQNKVIGVFEVETVEQSLNNGHRLLND